MVESKILLIWILSPKGRGSFSVKTHVFYKEEDTYDTWDNLRPEHQKFAEEYDIINLPPQEIRNRFWCYQDGFNAARAMSDSESSSDEERWVRTRAREKTRPGRNSFRDREIERSHQGLVASHEHEAKLQVKLRVSFNTSKADLIAYEVLDPS